ncbi:MAG: mechanosensitive ion channel [Bacteroidaceae bacterium]|nr:mechanosensitive ion channel [Bacteroidaceae bacterium]
MNKRIPRMMKPLLFVLMAIMVSVPAEAVLKERNLPKTLKVLCAELETNYREQKRFMASAEKRTQKRHNEMITLMQRSQQISLMLYSLPSDYVFDITYACEQATQLYDEFNKNVEDSETSFNYSRHLFEDVNRYDALIRALECLPPAINQPKSELEELAASDTVANDTVASDSSVVRNKSKSKNKVDALTKKVEEEHPYMLTENEQKIRDRCILYAKALRNNYVRLYNSTKEDERYYKEVSTRLSELNEYALKQYDKLRRTALEGGGDNYFKTLSSLPSRYQSGKNKFKDKYSRLQTKSDWRGPVVAYVSILIIFYMALASALSYLLIILLPKMFKRLGRFVRKHEIYEDKKLMISYALGMAIFAVAIGLVKFAMVHNHLVLMATSFMYEYAWLLFVIILSLTIRLSGKQMRHGMASYVPFLTMVFMVIIMRIVFMPISIINLLLPPIMLATTIWQIFNQKRHREHLAKSDLVFSYISLAAMVYATAATWMGYSLAAVETMVWWSFQLTFIQTIVCIRDIVAKYEKTRFMARLRRKNNIPAGTTDAQLLAQMRKGDFVSSTWLYDFIRITLIPVLALVSIMASVVLEAEFFNSANLCKEYFEKDFLDVPDVIQMSLMKLYVAGVLFFIFRYVLYVVSSGYRVTKEQHATKHKRQQANISLANNTMTLLVWGIYFIFCLVLFNVPKTGISVISAGLATGLGFAMKELLENFFYGISLMTGRVRVGDYIECDGTFGRVESITYQSTQISIIDGGTVAFLNRSLFSKNFRNLTRTSNYTLVKLSIGVAYGSNVEQVRTVLIDHLNAFYAEYKAANAHMHRPTINDKGFHVVFKDFGDSSVDLLITYWVLVEQRIPFNAMVKEQIYNALNNAGIEIPFPQRDVHIIKAVE